MVSSFLAVWAVVASLLRQFVMHCFDSGTFNALALLSESENLVVSLLFRGYGMKRQRHRRLFPGRFVR
jgi:hypothetical protein